MAYNGQRGPNVSKFIASLNTIPSPQDLAQQEPFGLDDDLAMFTNTQFFDFDLAQDANLQPGATFGFNGQQPQQAAPDNVTSAVDEKSMFFMPGDIAFPDFASFSQQPNFSAGSLLMYPPTTSSPSEPASAASPQAGDKRPAESISDAPYAGATGFEEMSRIAAEEDKRRRNTAASARFRVKKKQREQALEKSAKEMTDKVAALEGRINQLETENKWLKNLVMEKNVDNKDDITALWKKYNQATSVERKTEEVKDGVGTEEA